MSEEATTDAIHEDMYKKIKDSLETEEEKKIRYLNTRKTRPSKKLPDKPTISKKMDSNKCGAPNWSRHECPARGKKCATCGKICHFAKCCRSNRKVNHVKGETSSAGEDDWSQDTIGLIKQNIHSSTRSTNNNGPEFFTITAMVNIRPVKFPIDSGSTVKLISKSQFNNITPLRPLETIQTWMLTG